MLDPIMLELQKKTTDLIDLLNNTLSTGNVVNVEEIISELKNISLFFNNSIEQMSQNEGAEITALNQLIEIKFALDLDLEKYDIFTKAIGFESTINLIVGRIAQIAKDPNPINLEEAAGLSATLWNISEQIQLDIEKILDHPANSKQVTEILNRLINLQRDIDQLVITTPGGEKYLRINVSANGHQCLYRSCGIAKAEVAKKLIDFVNSLKVNEHNRIIISNNQQRLIMQILVSIDYEHKFEASLTTAAIDQKTLEKYEEVLAALNRPIEEPDGKPCIIDVNKKSLLDVVTAEMRPMQMISVELMGIIAYLDHKSLDLVSCDESGKNCSKRTITNLIDPKDQITVYYSSGKQHYESLIPFNKDFALKKLSPKMFKSSKTSPPKMVELSKISAPKMVMPSYQDLTSFQGLPKKLAKLNTNITNSTNSSHDRSQESTNDYSKYSFGSIASAFNNISSKFVDLNVRINLLGNCLNGVYRLFSGICNFFMFEPRSDQNSTNYYIPKDHSARTNANTVQTHPEKIQRRNLVEFTEPSATTKKVTPKSSNPIVDRKKRN